MTATAALHRTALRPVVMSVGWCLLILGLIMLALWGARVTRAALSLRDHLTQLQTMLIEPTALEPGAACAVVHGLRTDIVALDRDAGWLAGLAPLFGGLPRVGGELRAAPHLLATAEGLSEAGSAGCQAFQPVLTDFATDRVSLQDVAGILDQQQAAWPIILAAAERAETAWAQVDIAGLSPGAAPRLQPLERLIPLLRPGLSALRAAPRLFGMDRPRTYLILALNEDELRPGGGFITGVGEVRLDAGRIVAMTFRDSYAVDDFTQPYPDPPEPLRRYLGLDLWVMRDSNWSPDFPTAARQAAALYRPGYPATIDGVIAVDQRGVQGVVAALAPLAIGSDGQAITAETVVAFMRAAWTPDDGKMTAEWWKQRKSFMGPLAEAIWQRVERGQVDWLKLARAGQDLLQGKHLLIYLEDPAVQGLLATLGWDAALRPAPGDFLAIVDANLGYNKANARIRQSAAYRVDLAGAPPTASLTVTYTHTATRNYPCRPEIRYDPIYEQMMDRCYWDYVRVYVPQDSRLRDATRHPTPASALWSGVAETGAVTVREAAEGPWLSLEALNLLPTASTLARRYDLTLPAGVVHREGDEGQYTLRLFKQPGTAPYPVTVTVRLPDGATLLDAASPAAPDAQGWRSYRVTLDRDQVVRIRWREAR